MTKPVKFDESGDSQDLQALFDTIAGNAVVTPEPGPSLSGDSDELQSLFDSVKGQMRVLGAYLYPAPDEKKVAADMDSAAAADGTYNRLGQIARKLHDSLRELGYDKGLEETAKKIPDARERLNYISSMTEQAASRVLNATDIAIPAQNELELHTRAMSNRWDKMFANQLSVDEFKTLAADTRTFFAVAPSKIDITKTQLTEIVMAQDFQDLTGQVIKKVVDIVQGIETQILQVLIDAMPEDKKTDVTSSLPRSLLCWIRHRRDLACERDHHLTVIERP